MVYKYKSFVFWLKMKQSRPVYFLSIDIRRLFPYDNPYTIIQICYDLFGLIPLDELMKQKTA